VGRCKGAGWRWCGDGRGGIRVVSGGEAGVGRRLCPVFTELLLRQRSR
jgi:hypothetical protein